MKHVYLIFTGGILALGMVFVKAGVQNSNHLQGCVGWLFTALGGFFFAFVAVSLLK